MAKRKRLTPAKPDYLGNVSHVSETKPMPFAPAPAPTRVPIAQVAGEASAASALQELAGEMKRARDEGRLIQALPEAEVEVGYLVRDRMLANDEELRVLMESLRARGQQTPIEVVKLDEGRFGLISGWRRLTALRRLLAETGDSRFARVQAILRRPETAADAYVAMVEENEVRVGLSYYERARVAAKAVEQGAYTDEKQALLALFASASRAKRSKIRSFLTIYHACDDLLNFPTAIPERLGLALAKALDADASWSAVLRDALTRTPRPDAAQEIASLEQALTEGAAGYVEALKPSLERPVASNDRPRPQPEAKPERTSGFLAPVQGIHVSHGAGTVTLSGPGVTKDFRARLLNWVALNS